MRNRLALTVVCILGLLVLASCLPGDGRNAPDNPAGFFTGFWHGLVAPISLVVQLFKPAIRVYEAHNVGFWYDFGFWLALASGSGGGVAASHRSRRRQSA